MVINDKYCAAKIQNIEPYSKGNNQIIFILQKCWVLWSKFRSYSVVKLSLILPHVYARRFENFPFFC